LSKSATVLQAIFLALRRLFAAMDPQRELQTLKKLRISLEAVLVLFDAMSTSILFGILPCRSRPLSANSLFCLFDMCLFCSDFYHIFTPSGAEFMP
jgi:hypothetical protein